MKLLVFALLVMSSNAHAAIDCQHLDLSGSWSVSLDSSYPLQGIYDESTIALTPAAAGSNQFRGRMFYQGIDGYGVYFQQATEVTASVNASCTLSIQKISSRFESFRNFDDMTPAHSEENHFYGEREGLVQYQIKANSSLDRLELSNGSTYTRGR